MTVPGLPTSWHQHEPLTMIDQMGEAFEKGYVRFARFNWNPTSTWMLNETGTDMELVSTWDKPYTVRCFRPATGYLEYVFNRQPHYTLENLTKLLLPKKLDEMIAQRNEYNQTPWLSFFWLIMVTLPLEHDRRKLVENITVLGKLRQDEAPPVSPADSNLPEPDGSGKFYIP